MRVCDVLARADINVYVYGVLNAYIHHTPPVFASLHIYVFAAPSFRSLCATMSELEFFLCHVGMERGMAVVGKHVTRFALDRYTFLFSQ